MIRCNGSSGAGRETHANETPAGSTGPSAPLKRHFCAAFVSIAARSIKIHSLISRRFPSIMAAGSRNEDAKLGRFWNVSGSTKSRAQRPRVNPSLIRTYLLCALSRHSWTGCGSLVSAIGGLAANIFRSHNNIVEAVNFAKTIDLPLVAHLTVHWAGTVAFDDHDGTRFAKVREGLAKVLIRRGIPPAWAWCRE
jgi:hypothetical protein